MRGAPPGEWGKRDPCVVAVQERTVAIELAMDVENVVAVELVVVVEERTVAVYARGGDVGRLLLVRR